jgi:hypothetical protein
MNQRTSTESHTQEQLSRTPHSRSHSVTVLALVSGSLPPLARMQSPLGDGHIVARAEVCGGMDLAVRWSLLAREERFIFIRPSDAVSNIDTAPPSHSISRPVPTRFHTAVSELHAAITAALSALSRSMREANAASYLAYTHPPTMQQHEPALTHLQTRITERTFSSTQR